MLPGTDPTVIALDKYLHVAAAGDNLCWAASLQIVLEKLGKQISQHEIASLKTRASNATAPEIAGAIETCLADIRRCNQAGSPVSGPFYGAIAGGARMLPSEQWSPFWLRFDAMERLDWDALCAQFRQQQPVILGFSYVASSGGHYMVAVGAESSPELGERVRVFSPNGYVASELEQTIRRDVFESANLVFMGMDLPATQTVNYFDFRIVQAEPAPPQPVPPRSIQRQEPPAPCGTGNDDIAQADAAARRHFEALRAYWARRWTEAGQSPRRLELRQPIAIVPMPSRPIGLALALPGIDFRQLVLQALHPRSMLCPVIDAESGDIVDSFLVVHDGCGWAEGGVSLLDVARRVLRRQAGGFVPPSGAARPFLLSSPQLGIYSLASAGDNDLAIEPVFGRSRIGLGVPAAPLKLQDFAQRVEERIGHRF